MYRHVLYIALFFACSLFNLAHAECWQLSDGRVVQGNRSSFPLPYGARAINCPLPEARTGAGFTQPTQPTQAEQQRLNQQRVQQQREEQQRAEQQRLAQLQAEQQRKAYEVNQRKYQQGNIATGGMCSPKVAVYQCKRKLGDTQSRNGAPKQVGPLLPLFHEYLCVRTSKGYVCGGHTTSGNLMYGNGAQDTQSVYSANLCQPISGDFCVARCVAQQLANTTRPSYSVKTPLGTDCQEWGDQVATQCVSQCSVK